MNIISNFRDLLNQDVKLMNPFKKIFFIFLAFAGHTTFAHTYNEAANQEALDAIHTYQRINSINTPSRSPWASSSPYWDAPNGPWKQVLDEMVSRVKQAINEGANPDLIIYDQTTLFLFMIHSCDKKLLDEFIKVGANINAKNGFGWTALMDLGSSKNSKSIELATTLINTRGIDIDTKDKDGKTALMHACFWGNHELVKALLDAGANRNKIDKYGRTARDIADQCYDNENRKQCIEYLETISSDMVPFITLTVLVTSAIGG
jgi:ankyrin repeat protein